MTRPTDAQRTFLKRVERGDIVDKDQPYGIGNTNATAAACLKRGWIEHAERTDRRRYMFTSHYRLTEAGKAFV
jgi:hypothetical protein